MATKAELEASAAAFRDGMSRAREADSHGRFAEAIELAASAWPYLDGAIQYEQKYNGGGGGAGPAPAATEAFSLVLRRAPLTLASRALDRMEQVLAERTRIQKNAEQDLAALLARARAEMGENRRLWCHLERTPGARQDELRQALGGDQDRWRAVAEAWEKMGVLCRAPDRGSYRLSLATRLGQPAAAKCPACGRVVKAAKLVLLQPATCPGCKSKVSFVLLTSSSPSPPTEGKGQGSWLTS